MAQMNYLTQCTFDFGALAQLPKVLKANGVSRPFVVTDAGLKANGLLDTLLAALGEPPAVREDLRRVLRTLLQRARDAAAKPAIKTVQP